MMVVFGSDSAACHSSVFSQPSGIEDGFRNTTYVFGSCFARASASASSPRLAAVQVHCG
jgi:hypothetical protein